MTVLSELSKIAYIGSSSQTLYPIPFEYINTDDVKVSIYTSNNEFVENWTYSVQYVIEGGNVKVLSGYNIDNTKKLLILRMVDLVQDNKYREGGDFPAKSTETSFDKLTMITQQLQETLDRCVKVEVLDIQSPEELLQTVYDKLDSATEIAGDAISAANQAQTAADNATAAVNSAEQTLVQTQAYVDSAKVEINNTKNTAINTINSTVTQAKADINTAVSNAESNISTIVSDAEGSITSIAVTEANKAIANAAQEATNIAVAKLQPYVNQAQEDANSAAASMEQAALSATAASADADNAAESAGLAANSASEAAIHNFKNKITNCITEIPQDIKLELKDGTLTLKAGSKVYVPNGFKANGVTPKFDEYLISSDLTFSGTTATEHKCMLFIKQVNGAYGWVNDTNTYSGTDTSTKTSTMCYRTDLNRIIYQNDVNAANYSFPICIFKYLDTVTSIDQVFNGFGYIGSTVFALPGIKGLIPNGRNSDGTLKNIEFVNSSVKLCNNTVTANNMCLVIPKGANSVFDGFKYIASEEKPTSDYTLWYNPTENTCRWKTTGDFGNTPCIYIGSFNRDSGKVTSFTPKTAFHAVDYNDYAREIDQCAKLDKDNTFTGFNTFKIGSILGKSSTSGGLSRFKTPDAFNSSAFTDVWLSRNEGGSNGPAFAVLRVSDDKGNIVNRQVGIFKENGTNNIFTLAPTPPTTDNSTQIATTAFFRNNMQVVSTLPASPVSGVFYFIPE